jgi:hypothetical protein
VSSSAISRFKNLIELIGPACWGKLSRDIGWKFVDLIFLAVCPMSRLR